MYIFLPNEMEGLSDLEDDLDADKINEVIDDVRELGEVNVRIPKFKITHQLSVKKYLQKLGELKMSAAVAQRTNVLLVFFWNRLSRRTRGTCSRRYPF